MLVVVKYGYSQEITILKKRIEDNSFFSIGRSTFKTNLATSPKFPTLEVRVGAGLVKKLNETIDIRSRLVLGAKFVRGDSINSGATVVSPPFYVLDELSNKKKWNKQNSGEIRLV